MAVKTKVQKSPKYKGAPLAPKVAKPKPKPKAKAKAKKRKTKWYPGKLVEGIFGSKKKRLKKAYEAEGATKEEAKKKAKKKARGAGRIRKGAVGVESTKGGEYAKYGKKSKPAKSFRSAFAAAKGKDFTWDGRKYSGKKAEDKKKVAPKKTAPKKTAPKKTAPKLDIDVTQHVKNIAQAEKAKKAAAKPKKDVGGKDAWKAPADKYRQKKQAGGMVAPPPPDPSLQPSISPSAPSYKKGGKVESNPYGWPSRDARNGGKK